MTAAIVAVTLVLIGVWFRYTCLMILRSAISPNYAQQVAIANELNFPKVREELAGGARELDLRKLYGMLESDYRLLTFLTRHGARYDRQGHEMERWLLHIDFHLMRICCCLTRGSFTAVARFALTEMAMVVARVASLMGGCSETSLHERWPSGNLPT